MKKGEATRARILDEAATQASVRGLAAVSLGDVAEAIGMSKSGLFKHFHAKEAMQQAALEATMARFVGFVWEPVKSMPAGRRKIEALFERQLDWIERESGPGGCLIQQASVELDDQPGPLREFLRQGQLRWQKTLRRELAALRDPPLSEEEAEQAHFEMNGIAMSFGEALRLFGDDNARRRANTAFQRLLERTLPNRRDY